jgi:hypothetical protein
MGLVARVGYPKVPLLTFPSRQDVKMAKVEYRIFISIILNTFLKGHLALIRITDINSPSHPVLMRFNRRHLALRAYTKSINSQAHIYDRHFSLV